MVFPAESFCNDMHFLNWPASANSSDHCPYIFRMQTVCQDFLEALDHFEEMLEKVERDLGLFES